MPDLDALLHKARDKNIFGTKMRSVIKTANADGVNAVVAQQFDVGRQIIAAGLVPIIEPEVDINSPQKAAAEELLKAALMAHLDQLDEGQLVMLKLTLPEQDEFLRQLHRTPECTESRRSVRRLFARRSKSAARCPARHGGQFFPCA